MIQTSVTIDTKNTSKMGKAANRGNEEAIINVLSRMVSRAKRLAPVQYGLLRGSIQYLTSTKADGLQMAQNPKGETVYPLQQRVKKGEGYIGASAKYAQYQEFGTRYQRAQPFMIPAITAEIEAQKVQGEVERQISKEARRDGL